MILALLMMLLPVNNILNIHMQFGIIKKVFVVAMTFFASNVLKVNSLKWFSMNNQEYKVRS